jgi:hypothetical protein
MNRLTLDQMQFYLARGASLHPVTRQQYNSKILDLYHKGKISLMPCVLLQMYSDQIYVKLSKVA